MRASSRLPCAAANAGLTAIARASASLNLGSAFNTGVSIGQTLFTVGQGNQVTLQFQVAEKSTDVVNLNFLGSTAQQLGLVTDTNGNRINVASVASAAIASSAIDTAIDAVNTAQANVGALQSPFNYIQSTLATTTENVSAAKSSFFDANIAEEQTNFTRASILEQASISMLAQANQQTQQLLKLLQ
jgi:flagellin